MTSAKTRQKPKKQPETPDPISSLLMMCAEALSSPAIPCEPVWKTRKTKSGRTEYQLLNLGRPAAEASDELWPTPCSRDFKGTNSWAGMKRQDGKSRTDQLPNAVKTKETEKALLNGQVLNEEFLQFSTRIEEKSEGQKKATEPEGILIPTG